MREIMQSNFLLWADKDTSYSPPSGHDHRCAKQHRVAQALPASLLTTISLDTHLRADRSDDTEKERAKRAEEGHDDCE